jgi:hypothetical protein
LVPTQILIRKADFGEWKYVNYMKNIFQSIGLDHYYYGNFNTNIFKHFFGKAVQDKELSRRLEISCLSNYNTFNVHQILQNNEHAVGQEIR